MSNEFLDDDYEGELRDVALDGFRCRCPLPRSVAYSVDSRCSEEDSLIAADAEEFPSSPAAAARSSDDPHVLAEEGEDQSLLRATGGALGGSPAWRWRPQGAVRSALMAARAFFVFASHCMRSAAAAASRLFARESSGGYSLAGPAPSATARRNPLRSALAALLIMLIARSILVRRPPLNPALSAGP
jgi:hypothetical protein